MALNLLGDFFSFLTPSLFSTASIIMIISFILWELPRSIKIMDDEYTKDLYPENSRVADFFFLFCGILALFYLVILQNSIKVLTYLRTPGITIFFLVIMVTIPLIILMGYLKRFFERMNKHESLTVFLVHSFMDLMHTLFFITISILLVPVIGYLTGPLK